MAILLTPLISDFEGEIAFGKLLQSKLSDDYLCWHSVSIKSPNKAKRERFPDFILFHPQRGFWILEVKDWSLSYIKAHNPKEFTLTDRTETNPYEQAQRQAWILLNLIKKSTPVVWGAIFCELTREEFEHPEKTRRFATAGRLGNIPSHHVLCSDELRPGCSPMKFEQQLVTMFSAERQLSQLLDKAQIKKLRDVIFPDIQLDFDTSDLLRSTEEVKLFDIEQEIIFRKLAPDSGKHFLFGVAGSGKTIILLNKARELLQEEDFRNLNIIYLCRGTRVAKRIQEDSKKMGLPPDMVFSFHRWCGTILKTQNLGRPTSANGAPTKLLEEFKRGNVKSLGYDVILFDEAHDFRDEPEKLELISFMRKSDQSLFVIAYDDAQAIYANKSKIEDARKFFEDLSAQKHILRHNYRNTEQILLFAKVLGSEFLIDAENDTIPKVRPIAHGKQGKFPILLQCSSFEEELKIVSKALKESRKSGRPWSEISVLFHTYDFKKLEPFARKIEKVLKESHIPCSCDEADFSRNVVKIMSIKKAKGLGLGAVYIVGVSQTEFNSDEREKTLTKKREYLKEDIAYLYNALTRAQEELTITYTKPEEGTLAHRRVRKLEIALAKLKLTERT